MSNLTKTFFKLMQRVIFKEIGTRLRTDILKKLMDPAFSLFEKTASTIPILSNIYIGLYNDVIKKEIAMANIKTDDKILVIGCGALPVTPVLITRMTGSYVTCIDHDRSVIKKASFFIDSMSLNDKIKVEHADGVGYPIESFNVIVIVYGVKPSDKILAYVSDQIKNKNTRVILRTTIDNQGRLPIDIPTSLEIKNTIRLDSLGAVDSILLQKITKTPNLS
ncbi:MAG: hypothetical protein QXS02_00555 [Candidatus Thermoplasmatota archaeon]